MAKRIKKKLPRDVNARAFAIGELATGNAEPESAKAEAGRKGGLKGGAARAAKMTKAERSAIARRAAQRRWTKGTE